MEENKILLATPAIIKKYEKVLSLNPTNYTKPNHMK